LPIWATSSVHPFTFIILSHGRTDALVVMDVWIRRPQMSGTEEAAKAVQETAKLGQEIVKNLGPVEKVATKILGPFGELYGLATDIARYAREEINWRIANKRAVWRISYEHLEALNVQIEDVKPIPLRLAYSFSEKIEVEDDPTLQGLWANLLVNCSLPGSGINPSRLFGKLISEMDADDAFFLNELGLRRSDIRSYFIVAGGHDGTYAEVQPIFRRSDLKLVPASSERFTYDELMETFRVRWSLVQLELLLDRLASLGLLRWVHEAHMAMEVFENEVALAGPASQMDLLKTAVASSTGDIDLFMLTELGDAFITAVSPPGGGGPS
jgi:hypothetical protein